jgi:hypothetical protein
MKIDPHLNEPVAALDPDVHGLYLVAKENAKAWQAEADRLELILNEQLGDAYAGTVNGFKVVTHRPTATYRIKALVEENPQLAQHYFKKVVKDEFDVAAFGAQHADVLERYRSRSFRTLAALAE